ncbi:MAG: hypothetical protein JW748_06260 [Anaerolineales bacterium]|nr:hypothetical protein [Anaerolineales bacterium]
MQPPIAYPLTFSFKILSFASQFSVRDSGGNLIAYARQKILALKEAVTVFADEERTRPLFTIQADRIIDWSARYNFTSVEGANIGAVKRRGMRSLWKATYDILEGDNPVMTIQEENPWIRMADGLLSEVPILGMFSGYFFHPAYLVTRADSSPVMRMTKQRAFFEGKFLVEKLANLTAIEEQRVLLSLMMAILLERSRG